MPESFFKLGQKDQREALEYVRAETEPSAAAISDHAIASTVAQHKSHFFMEKDMDGEIIDYFVATTGKLKIVPDGNARTALAKDYESMMADEVMVGDALPFDALLDACAAIEATINESTMILGP